MADVNPDFTYETVHYRQLDNPVEVVQLSINWARIDSVKVLRQSLGAELEGLVHKLAEKAKRRGLPDG